MPQPQHNVRRLLLLLAACIIAALAGCIVDITDGYTYGDQRPFTDEDYRTGAAP